MFNSAYESSYIHYRNKWFDYEGFNTTDNICRTGLNQRSLLTEFSFNTDSNVTLISDTADGFIRATELYYSTGYNQFIQRIYGSIELVSESISPSTHITFGATESFTHNISMINENMSLITNNFGIGTPIMGNPPRPPLPLSKEWTRGQWTITILIPTPTMARCMIILNLCPLHRQHHMMLWSV